MSKYLSKIFGLDSKVAVVIGGGGFLCSTIAKGLAKAGAKVAVVDKVIDKAKTVVDQIKAEGSQAIAISLDVIKKEEQQNCLNNVIKEFGTVDILVNGAGINAPTDFLEISLDEWRAILDSHVTGTFLACQVFGSYMIKKAKGSIINIASASAGPPLSKAFTYSVAKAGIYNLTQNLGREWATKGVRVNALRPGFFPTEWSKKNFITPERDKAILGHTPMGRYGKPEELVSAVIWLSCDSASFVTGSLVTVDGGFTCMTI